MDQLTIFGHDDDWVFKQFLATYDAPAYIRRARQTQAAYDDLLERCRQQRTEWLKLARSRLATLRALAGSWEGLRPWLASADPTRHLEELCVSLDLPPAPRAAPAGTARAIRQALRELCESLERFNRRWETFLRELDLGAINALRDSYNRYYVLEKECAVRSPRVARQGFVPVPPLAVEELASLFPLLPVPVLAG